MPTNVAAKIIPMESRNRKIRMPKAPKIETNGTEGGVTKQAFCGPPQFDDAMKLDPINCGWCGDRASLAGCSGECRRSTPILCRLGFHRWRKVNDTLGCYGMGLEWFECWECKYCPATADQLRGGTGWKSYQVHPTRQR